MCILNACVSAHECGVMCVRLWRPEGIGSPRVGVKGSCKLPDMGAGTQTCILYKFLTTGTSSDLSILFLRQSFSLVLGLTDLAELTGQ